MQPAFTPALARASSRLAKQLQAVVDVAPGFPGTTICLEHTQLALVVDDAARQLQANDAADQAATPRGG